MNRKPYCVGRWNLKCSFRLSLEVIKNGTIRKLGYGFLFAFHSNNGRIFNRFDTIHERDGQADTARQQELRYATSLGCSRAEENVSSIWQTTYNVLAWKLISVQHYVKDRTTSSVSLKSTFSYLLTVWCTGHVGGLLALFLGASIITCLELLDVVTRRCFSVCRRHQPTQPRKRCVHRKSNPQHGADANHAHFRSADDVTTDTLPVANHTDALRGVLKTPSPLPMSVAPCSGRFANTNTSNTSHRSSVNNRSAHRPSPLAETDI